MRRPTSFDLIAPDMNSAGPGVYRGVATQERGQADRAALDKFRRGYSVSANVITRSGGALTYGSLAGAGSINP